VLQAAEDHLYNRSLPPVFAAAIVELGDGFYRQAVRSIGCSNTDWPGEFQEGLTGWTQSAVRIASVDKSREAGGLDRKNYVPGKQITLLQSVAVG
jgi:hypothetical protein